MYVFHMHCYTLHFDYLLHAYISVIKMCVKTADQTIYNIIKCYIYYGDYLLCLLYLGPTKYREITVSY